MCNFFFHSKFDKVNFYELEIDHINGTSCVGMTCRQFHSHAETVDHYFKLIWSTDSVHSNAFHFLLFRNRFNFISSVDRLAYSKQKKSNVIKSSRN